MSDHLEGLKRELSRRSKDKFLKRGVRDLHSYNSAVFLGGRGTVRAMARWYRGRRSFGRNSNPILGRILSQQMMAH